ncbi:MAG: hypothetical protein ACRES7_11925 [Gammaproteobacteria bacterium]
MEESALFLEPEAVESLRRTRPWMYFLAAVTVIVCVIMACVLIAGILGYKTNPAQASMLMGGGAGGLIVGVLFVIVQFGYAIALSDVEQTQQTELREAVERACIRQRNLWIVMAIAGGLSALAILFQTVSLLF